jgi:hypothetical protein
MDISRDNGLVVDRDYEDRARYAFTGTVKEVVFDLKPVPPEAGAYCWARARFPPARPDWIPRLIWSATEDPPFETVCGQLQLRSLNTLGSAPAGAATATAAPTARVALTRIFDTNRCSPR